MKNVATVTVILIVIVAVAGTLFAGCLSSGFDLSELQAPEIVYAETVRDEEPSLSDPGHPDNPHITLKWSITEEIYARAGGALWLNVENENPSGRLYIYGFGIEWEDGTSTYRNCSTYVDSQQEISLGLLVFNAPSEPGPQRYSIVANAASSKIVRGPLGQAFEVWRHRTVVMPSEHRANVLPLIEEHEQNVERNNAPYYAKINSLVSYEAANGIADQIKARWPGTGKYNIMQVIEAYEWVRKNITYRQDVGSDHWQSASETLSKMSGDCEDHAILLASMIGALGGNARVNIVEGHAFSTVFIGTDEQRVAEVRAAVASYYGMPVEQMPISYLVDDTGYWLIVDTTGFPYAGGLPTQSGYTSPERDWSIRSDFLYMIDATGDSIWNLIPF